jgi:hypothetical protein
MQRGGALQQRNVFVEDQWLGQLFSDLWRRHSDKDSHLRFRYLWSSCSGDVVRCHTEASHHTELQH